MLRGLSCVDRTKAWVHSQGCCAFPGLLSTPRAVVLSAFGMNLCKSDNQTQRPPHSLQWAFCPMSRDPTPADRQTRNSVTWSSSQLFLSQNSIGTNPTQSIPTISWYKLNTKLHSKPHRSTATYVDPQQSASTHGEPHWSPSVRSNLLRPAVIHIDPGKASADQAFVQSQGFCAFPGLLCIPRASVHSLGF